jgi:hypothetical protein
MRKTLCGLLLAGVVAVSACSSPPPPPQLDSSCAATDVDATTGISVVLWQPSDSGKAIYVHQVTADYYGTKVTVKVNKAVWFNPDQNVEVDAPLPSSDNGLPLSAGCKIVSWR